MVFDRRGGRHFAGDLARWTGFGPDDPPGRGGPVQAPCGPRAGPVRVRCGRSDIGCLQTAARACPVIADGSLVWPVKVWPVKPPSARRLLTTGGPLRRLTRSPRPSRAAAVPLRHTPTPAGSPTTSPGSESTTPRSRQTPIAGASCPSLHDPGIPPWRPAGPGGAVTRGCGALRPARWANQSGSPGHTDVIPTSRRRFATRACRLLTSLCRLIRPAPPGPVQMQYSGPEEATHVQGIDRRKG